MFADRKCASFLFLRHSTAFAASTMMAAVCAPFASARRRRGKAHHQSRIAVVAALDRSPTFRSFCACARGRARCGADRNRRWHAARPVRSLARQRAPALARLACRLAFAFAELLMRARAVSRARNSAPLRRSRARNTSGFTAARARATTARLVLRSIRELYCCDNVRVRKRRPLNFNS